MLTRCRACCWKAGRSEGHPSDPKRWLQMPTRVLWVNSHDKKETSKCSRIQNLQQLWISSIYRGNRFDWGRPWRRCYNCVKQCRSLWWCAPQRQQAIGRRKTQQTSNHNAQQYQMQSELNLCSERGHSKKKSGFQGWLRTFELRRR